MQRVRFKASGSGPSTPAKTYPDGCLKNTTFSSGGDSKTEEAGPLDLVTRVYEGAETITVENRDMVLAECRKNLKNPGQKIACWTVLRQLAHFEPRLTLTREDGEFISKQAEADLRVFGVSQNPMYARIGVQILRCCGDILDSLPQDFAKWLLLSCVEFMKWSGASKALVQSCVRVFSTLDKPRFVDDKLASDLAVALGRAPKSIMRSSSSSADYIGALRTILHARPHAVAGQAAAWIPLLLDFIILERSPQVRHLAPVVLNEASRIEYSIVCSSLRKSMAAIDSIMLDKLRLQLSGPDYRPGLGIWSSILLAAGDSDWNLLLPWVDLIRPLLGPESDSDRREAAMVAWKAVIYLFAFRRPEPVEWREPLRTLMPEKSVEGYSALVNAAIYIAFSVMERDPTTHERILPDMWDSVIAPCVLQMLQHPQGAVAGTKLLTQLLTKESPSRLSLSKILGSEIDVSHLGGLPEGWVAMNAKRINELITCVALKCPRDRLISAWNVYMYTTQRALQRELLDRPDQALNRIIAAGTACLKFGIKELITPFVRAVDVSNMLEQRIERVGDELQPTGSSSVLTVLYTELVKQTRPEELPELTHALTTQHARNGTQVSHVLRSLNLTAPDGYAWSVIAREAVDYLGTDDRGCLLSGGAVGELLTNALLLEGEGNGCDPENFDWCAWAKIWSMLPGHMRDEQLLRLVERTPEEAWPYLLQVKIGKPNLPSRFDNLLAQIALEIPDELLKFESIPPAFAAIVTDKALQLLPKSMDRQPQLVQLWNQLSPLAAEKDALSPRVWKLAEKLQGQYQELTLPEYRPPPPPPKKARLEPPLSPPSSDDRPADLSSSPPIKNGQAHKTIPLNRLPGWHKSRDWRAASRALAGLDLSEAARTMRPNERQVFHAQLSKALEQLARFQS